jgi:SAM-dependent methyltransferase
VNTAENTNMESPLDPAGSGGPDWEARYQAGDTPWEKGRAHPALVEWLRENRLTGTILVPGCGTGHDVRVLAADPAARVTGLDLAPSAKALAETFPKVGNETYIVGDFLSGSSVAPDAFDAVFEHTCFCAISPALRASYASAISAAIKPGGYFLAIFYMNPSHGGDDGPPFGCSVEELDALFERDFQLIREVGNLSTFDGRENREIIRLMRKLPVV